MLPIELRPESPADFRAVEELTRNAFWNHHAPGCDEHYLAHILRESSDFVPELDYVAVHAGKVVGNIMYTRAKIVLDRGGEREVLCFGPLAVDPAFQGQGVGGALIERTKTLARELGYKAILIFGTRSTTAGSGSFRRNGMAWELPGGYISSPSRRWSSSPEHWRTARDISRRAGTIR